MSNNSRTGHVVLLVLLSVLFTVVGTSAQTCPTLPAPEVRVIQGHNPACDEDVVLDASGPQYATYRWNDGITTPQHLYPMYGTQQFTVSVIGYDANGCASPPRYYSLSSGPLSDVSIGTMGSTRFCKTSTGGLYNAYTLGGGTATYQWNYSTERNGPFTPIPGATGSTYRLNGADFPVAGGYWINCTAVPTCGSPRTSLEQWISVEDTLQPPELIGPDRICPTGRGRIQTTNYWDSILWTIQHGRFVNDGICGSDPTSGCVGYEPDGTGDIILTVNVTSGACSSSESRTIAVRENDPPPFNVSALCAGRGSADSDYWLDGSKQWSVTNATIEGSSTDHNVTFVANGPGPVTVTLTLTDGFGCASSSTQTLDPAASTTPPITLGTPDICPYSTNTASTTPGFANYTWFVENGEVESGQGTPNLTFRSSSSSEPTRVSLYAEGASCPNSVDVPLRTISEPTISLGTPDICPGGTDTASVPASYTNYSWWVENGTITNGEGTNSITFRPDSSGQPLRVSFFGLDSGGCNTPPANITVPIRTIGEATITLGTPDVCPGGTDTASVPESYTNYYWWVENGTITNGEGTSSITFRPDSSGQPLRVSFFGLDSGGCTTPPANITVPIRTIGEATITLGTPDVCPGGTDTASVPASYTNYYWWVENGMITNGEGTSSITFRPDSSGQPLRVSFFGLDSGGCTTPPANITVPIRTIGEATITLGTPDVCPGGTDTASVPASYTNYYWWVENGTITNGEGTNSITFRPDSSGQPLRVSFFGLDSGGCTTPPASATVPIRTLASPVVTASGPTTFCEGGGVTLTASAGSSYAWSNGATTQSITAIESGSYSVTVTDANGCSATSAATTVTVNPLPAGMISTSGPTTFCEGGSVTLSAPAGMSSYAWENGATTQSITVTATSYHNVTFTNANGCSSTVGVPVQVNPSPAATITASGPTTFCEGGSVTLTAGTADSYSWSNGATTQSITVNASGSYSVTVTGSNGCSATSAPTEVIVNDAPDATITATGPTTFCEGAYVVLMAPAGASSYVWSSGETWQSITAIASGTYTVTVTGANGCFATSAPVTVINNPRPDATITASGPTTFCEGGSVTLSAAAGLASYAWSNGATTQSITVNASGIYSVNVTDSNGCTAWSSGTPVTVNPLPPQPTVTASGPTAFCAGGSVTLTASSAASYLWSNGATTQSLTTSASGDYSVTVTNASGCSATSAPVSVTAHPEVAGWLSVIDTACVGSERPASAQAIVGGAYVDATYAWSISGGTITQNSGKNIMFRAESDPLLLTVVITDANGCTVTKSRSVFVTSQPEPVITASGPTTFCEGGYVTLTANQGSPFGSYLWSNGATTQSILVDASGSYSVTVSGNECSATSQSVVVTVLPAPAVTITASGPTTFCEGGSVTLTASGASSYLWSNGATTPSITVTAAGEYSVVGTNASGCSNNMGMLVTTYPAPAATITPSGPTTFCVGGSVTLTASAGTSYLWSNGATTQSINATASGSYSVTVTNASGCSATSSPTTVTVNAAPAAMISASGPTTFCAGGSVTLTASAGASYLWSNGATTPSINATAGGSYSVTVTNASGCSATSAPANVVVNANPSTPTVTASGPTTFCAGGSVTLTAPAGFSYLWSTGATSQSIVVAATGSYTVTVTNASGCSSTSAPTGVTVNAATSITQQPQSKTIPKNTTTQLSVTATGTGTLTYQWYRGTSPSTATPISGATARTYTTPKLTRGTYTYWVRVTGSCGVVNSVTATINAQ